MRRYFVGIWTQFLPFGAHEGHLFEEMSTIAVGAIADGVYEWVKCLMLGEVEIGNANRSKARDWG